MGFAQRLRDSHNNNNLFFVERFNFDMRPFFCQGFVRGLLGMVVLKITAWVGVFDEIIVGRKNQWGRQK